MAKREQPRLNAKTLSLARRAARDEKVLTQLFNDILSSKEQVRYASFQALLHLSETQPKVLYPTWDFFVGLLTGDHPSRKYIAIHILARLTAVDRKKRFDKIFKEFYGLLDDPSVIPAAHVAGHSGMIALAKPHLQTRITNALLSIEETHHAPHRKELVKAYALRSFGEYLDRATRKKPIVDFARKQRKSQSPGTRRAAQRILDRWEK
jgi:hypothetical protein